MTCFFSDEFFIQTNHKNGVSRINQVEIMSKFYKCNSEDNIGNKINDDICGFQYVATYGSRVGGASFINVIQKIISVKKINNDICGFQYVATYGSRVGEPNIKAITTNKYRLTFKSSEI